MNTIDYVYELSEGNPGALTFIMECLKPENLTRAIPIFLRLEICPSIKGSNLYVLWNDLCDREIDKVTKLCSSMCPNDVLEDACSRQDRSGKSLVISYLVFD